MIGLFGKEKSYDSNKAVEIFDHLAQRDIFSSLALENRRKVREDSDKAKEIMIEGYHDVANNRIYLNLRSYRQKDIRFMKLLMYLFHVCHIIVCYHPTSTLVSVQENCSSEMFRKFCLCNFRINLICDFFKL